MAKIISGAQEKDTNFALMQGTEVGAAWRRAKESKDEEARAQMRFMMQIMEAKRGHDEERARALSDVNNRAQMGDAMAMQQQAIEAEAANAPPEQKMLQEFAGILGKITEPDARKFAVATFDDYATKLRKHGEMQAAQGMLDGAAQDADLFQPEQIEGWQQRMQSGEQPQNISQEIMRHRDDQAAAQQAVEENATAIEQATQLIQTAPRGFSRRQAEINLKKVASSQSAMSKPGAGDAALAQVQRDLLGTRKEFADAQNPETMKAPGLGQMTVAQRNEEMEKEPGIFGTGGPEIPPFRGGTHATVKQGAKAKPSQQNIQQAVSALVEETKDPLELAKALQAQGIPLTAETQKAVRAALQGRRTNAQAAAGADR